MRSDSILNTGITSASLDKAKRAKEAREARKHQKNEKRNLLLPAAEIVIAEINKEQEFVKTELLGMVNPTTPDDQIKSLLVSLNLYDQSMKKLKARLSNILRVGEGDD